MATHEQQTSMSVQEYFALEQSSDEIRYEYLEGLVYALAGESASHSIICGNIARALGNRLEDGPCCVFTSDMRVRISERQYVYPDVSVSCDPQDLTNDTMQSPRLVVEVLSPGTEARDRITKFDYYINCPTIEEYMLVNSRQADIFLYRRCAAKLWAFYRYGAGHTIELASLDITVPVSTIYQRIIFAEDPDQLV